MRLSTEKKIKQFLVDIKFALMDEYELFSVFFIKQWFQTT